MSNKQHNSSHYPVSLCYTALTFGLLPIRVLVAVSNSELKIYADIEARLRLQFKYEKGIAGGVSGACGVGELSGADGVGVEGGNGRQRYEQ
ncbi:hypothetical protein PoB_006551800 [Plakobranchus ocellatus]|uniref:Uncharacterized protein n=1 Tax=Plakobranchus ocellatus TaxID=259542 RepID=A0AAV4D490_9GAST|nr:hypothetical protein PoB_006551800 [Plakobranchus ocellatus]